MPPTTTTLVKIHRKGQITLPSHLRLAIGVGDGDVVEAKLWRGKIVITPRPVRHAETVIDTDSECTLEQRRIIDARLNQADDELKAGRTHGPFTAKQASAYIERLAKERASAAKRAKLHRPPP